MNRQDIVDSIKRRVPESLQGDNELAEYLEVCGELFYELRETIKIHDHYNDYQYVPESRLAMLARQFAFNPPRNVPSSVMRGVIRDIVEIYASKGVEGSIYWIFRILGWRATFSEVWLPNPELYDPKIKVLYPQYYDEPGLESDDEASRTIRLYVGDEYLIGREWQPYEISPSYYINGHILFGRNTIVPANAVNPRLVNTYIPSTDFDKIDYRNFLIGELNIREEGTFFSGRRFFDRWNTYTDLRIIGEKYTPEKTIRKPDVVMKTPYLIIEVNNQDYAQFIRPYEDGGVTYHYTEGEAFEIASTLIDYFLYEIVRPAHVKVLLLVSTYREEDTINVDSNLEINTHYVHPEIRNNNVGMEDEEDTWFSLQFEEYNPLVIGDTEYIIGAPSFHPINSWINTTGLQFGDSRLAFRFEATGPFSFSIENILETAYIYEEKSSPDPGEPPIVTDVYVATEHIHLRTPCDLVLTGDLSELPFRFQVKKTLTDDYQEFDMSSYTPGESLRLVDWLFMRIILKPDDLGPGYDVDLALEALLGLGIKAEVEWKTQLTNAPTP